MHGSHRWDNSQAAGASSSNKEDPVLAGDAAAFRHFNGVVHELNWLYIAIVSMVLLYMVSWIPSITPNVSIYTSTMDPMWDINHILHGCPVIHICKNVFHAENEHLKLMNHQSSMLSDLQFLIPHLF